MRTDLGVEPSTRWKYQIRPSGDRTTRKWPQPTGHCSLGQTTPSMLQRPPGDFFNGNLFSLDITCVCGFTSCMIFLRLALEEMYARFILNRTNTTLYLLD